MKKILLASVATAALFGVSAFAADMPVRAPVYKAAPAPMFNWSGFYVGGQIGYGWGHVSDFDPFGPATTTSRPAGWLGGAHAGYNWQSSALVLGLEADIEGSNFKKSYDPSTQNPFYVAGDTFRTTINEQGSIRARVGYAMDRTLFYATGGWAFARVETLYTFTGAAVQDKKTNDRDGWTLGGGVEYACAPNWTTRVEYRYTDFGTNTRATPFFGALGTTISNKLTENVVRAGLTYKFGY
jgi:outer membrane immunogenic protein